MTDQKPAFSRMRAGCLGLGLLALLLAPFAGANPMVEGAKRYTVEITASAVALYASLRLINSVLSTAQETEISGGAVLVSGTVQPLKVLDPVDDTVERVAAVVFALALVAGVVTLALGPVTGIGLALLGSGLIGLSMGRAQWGKYPLSKSAQALLSNARRLGLALGLVLPAGLLLAFAGGSFFTERAVERANTVIGSITQDLEPEDLTLPSQIPDASLPREGGVAGAIESLQNRFFDGAASISGSASNVAESTARYLDIAGTVMARADDLFVSFAELLVAYLFHLIVFPALVVFVLLRLLSIRPSDA